MTGPLFVNYNYYMYFFINKIQMTTKSVSLEKDIETRRYLGNEKNVVYDYLKPLL